MNDEPTWSEMEGRPHAKRSAPQLGHPSGNPPKPAGSVGRWNGRPRKRGPVATHDMIVIGGSAGALDPLIHLFSALPRRFPAAVFVVVHTAAENTGVLANVLSRVGPFPVETARDVQAIRLGRAYIAPPDQHLLIGRSRMALSRGPRENGFRPAIDPLFYSAARSYKNRVIGVLLSGGLDDGTYGLTVIKEHSGIAIVQSPDEALINGMPLSAIKNVEVDHIVKARELPGLLMQLVGRSVRTGEVNNMAKLEPAAETDELHPWGAETPILNGPPSIFTCPECGGSLWELQEGKVMRFRCHEGHSFSVDSLVLQQDDKLENALWTAARVLQEKAVLRRHLAERVGQQGLSLVASDYQKQAEDAEAKAAIIRRLVENSAGQGTTPKRKKKSTPRRHRVGATGQRSAPKSASAKRRRPAK
jgi:two-component system, chemotaxis family, protein-glutamate methylesterase/glutaminase